MIIPGNALLALLSPPQEIHGTREEEGGFGALLTATESHATSLPDQEEAERRALDSVLQVLMSICQSCTPANCLPAASAPGTGESDPVRLQPAAGLPLGLPPGLGTAPGLGETGGIDLPPGRVADGSHDIGQLAFPALDDQGTEPSPATAGAPENFSWLLYRQASTQDLSRLFMAQPTAALSVSTPTAELGTPAGAPLHATTPAVSRDSVLATAEAQFVSPGLLQTSLATAGERHEAVRETLPPSVSFPTLLHLHAQDDGLLQTATELLPPRFSSLSLLGLQQPGASWPPEVTSTLSLGGPALTAQLRVAGEEVFQSIRTTLQLAPGHAAPAVPWAVQATAPLTEAAVPLPTVPQTEVAAASAALWSRALAPEDTALSEYDASPASRPLPKSQGRAAATMPSVAPIATDSALSLVSPRATSHIPSAEPASTVPTPSHSLEDLGRPWPSPLPTNTVILHLEPRELGALLLRVRVNDRRLIASFQAQSPEAETLLRTHLPSLQESLSQHGFEVQPIAITQAAEGFSAHMGAGTGAFAQQHSAFQAFAEEQQAANAGGTQSEGDLHRTPRWPSEQRPRLLDVVI